MKKIADIKDSIVKEFMRNEEAAKVYGFTPGDDFAEHFNKISVESVLFYIVACVVWTMENLFEEHTRDTNAYIEEMIPHRPKWYRDKVLGFMKDKTLKEDSDEYDTEGMNEKNIAAAYVVKHAVAVEDKENSVLEIKVAGENKEKERCPLDEETEKQLQAYITEIKDAGVRFQLVNTEPDDFACEVDVYYDPVLLPQNIEEDCRATVRNYIENLPFNGEYSGMALMNELQKVEGVRIVDLKKATTTSIRKQLWTFPVEPAVKEVSSGKTEIAGTVTDTEKNFYKIAEVPLSPRYVPKAGYFKATSITINPKIYE